MERFTGTIEKLCDVDVKRYVKFVLGIPQSDWPKLTDPAKCGWAEEFQPLTERLMGYFPDCVSAVGLWYMAPGQVHPAHTDEQDHKWRVRLHVPIITNLGVIFTMDDGEHHMKVGSAYQFNTLARHAVENRGKTPRLHFVMDVRYR